MADVNERDAKLIQYLSEAYGKERELETSLQAHIAMTTKAPYKKRLQQHLKETKAHAKSLERRIKKLGGGGAPKVQTVVAKAMATTKGPMHLIRGSGLQEKMLKNAKTEYFNEHEEIATYLAIEVFAEKVGDRETAKLARDIRREEERMAKFLEGQIKSLTGAVVSEDVPPAQRKRGSRASGKSRSRASAKPKRRPAAKAKPRTPRTSKAKPARKRAGGRR
jgi:ferritin-like metal-binding protein YciE